MERLCVLGSWANADPDKPWEWESGLADRVLTSAQALLAAKDPDTNDDDSYRQTEFVSGSEDHGSDISGSGGVASMSPSTPPENAAAAAAATIAAAAAADPDWNREARRPPFVTIPLAVTEDMTLGTIDMDESVKRGQPVFLPGLLARAHRGGAGTSDPNSNLHSVRPRVV